MACNRYDESDNKLYDTYIKTDGEDYWKVLSGDYKVLSGVDWGNTERTVKLLMQLAPHLESYSVSSAQESGGDNEDNDK